MLPRHLISAKEGFSGHQLPRVHSLLLEEEGSFFCLLICFFMVLKIREELTGECLREDLGCSPDVPDLHAHEGTSAVTTLQQASGLGSDQGLFGHEATRERGRAGIHRRHSSFPGAENVMQMDLLPQKAAEIMSSEVLGTTWPHKE